MNYDKMEFIEVSVEDLKPNPRNPRIDLKPGMPMYEKLKYSLEKSDYIDPVIWNKRTGMIVGGHQRFAVMKAIAEEEGTPLTKLKVIAVDMPEEKQDVAMIALNKITGLWDEERLTQLLGELKDMDMVKETGFDDFEVQQLLEDERDIEDFFEDAEDGEFETDHPKKKKTVTCPFCGEAFEI